MRCTVTVVRIARCTLLVCSAQCPGRAGNQHSLTQHEKQTAFSQAHSLIYKKIKQVPSRAKQRADNSQCRFTTCCSQLSRQPTLSNRVVHSSPKLFIFPLSCCFFDTSKFLEIFFSRFYAISRSISKCLEDKFRQLQVFKTKWH